MEDVLGLGGRWCHALSNADALQMCAHQNVGWGLPITSVFSASSLPSVSGGSLGLFTGVCLPLVEFCHSGRRAGVSVGRMGTHCAVPRGKKVSVREMMEMCGWTDI